MVEQLLFFRNQSERPQWRELTPIQTYYDKIFTYSLQVQFSQACSGIASLEITVCNSEGSLCWEGSWRMLPSRWEQNAPQGKIQAWARKGGEIIGGSDCGWPLSTWNVLAQVGAVSVKHTLNFTDQVRKRECKIFHQSFVYWLHIEMIMFWIYCVKFIILHVSFLKHGY